MIQGDQDMTQVNLTQASNEWAKRPADQRFWNLDEMMAATTQSRTDSRELTVDMDSTHAVGWSRGSRVLGEGVKLRLGGEAGDALHDKYGSRMTPFTNWSFGQLCRTIGAPASYLQSLDPSTAADCVNEGLSKWRAKGFDSREALLHMNGSPKLKSLTSDRYVRVWNSEIVSRLGHLHAQGWRVPPARPSSQEGERTRIATEADCLNFGTRSVLSVKPGDKIAPAGLYASDHDMFAFLINPEAVIENGMSPGGMRRGTMIRQSEVGECSIWKLDFLFDTVCGNHIVWGAQDVSETRVRHTGSAHDRWEAIVRQVTESVDAGAHEQEAKIRDAQSFMLGNDEDEVIDFLFGKRLVAKRTARQAYALAEEHSDVHGDPRTAWGFVSGLTRLSQDTTFADKRTDLDLVAGKILAKATS
jgi:hypothetical protein